MLALEVRELRGQHETALAARAADLSRVYAASVERLLGHMDTAMLMLRDAYVRDTSPDSAELARLSRLLRQGALSEVALQMAVIGPDGMLLFSDLKRPDKPVDLSDREHFQVHLRSAADLLYISKPLRGRVSGRWSVQLTRRISDPQGRFLGVLVLSVSPEVFSAAGAEIGLGSGDVTSLVNDEGVLLARHPEVDQALGGRFGEGVLPHTGSARLQPSPVDGVERMSAFAHLRAYPLRAGVSLDPGAMRRALGGELAVRFSFAGVFSLLLVAALVLALRSVRQRESLGAELERQRQHFADAQAVARLGSWERPVDSEALGWSEGVFRIFGEAPGAFQPTLPLLLARVHVEDREALLEAGTRCREQGQPYQLEYRITRADGDERVVLEQGQLERDAAGAPLRLFGVLMDITEQRRLERSLRDAEQRWGWALEAARDGVWDWWVGSGEAYFSPRWKEILGYRADEFGDSFEAWRQALHPRDLVRVEKALADYFEGRSDSYEPEFRMRCKDGSYRWILARGRVLERDADGRPLRMLGTHSDITDRKLAEFALQVERSRLEEAQSVAHLGSWEWDLASGSLWWSQETYRIYGQPADFQPSYAAVLARVPDQERGAVEAAVRMCLDGRLAYDVEHRILRPDGAERQVREQGRVEFDEDGNPQRLIGVVQDVTDSRRLEQALRDANARWRFALDGAGTGVWDWDAPSGRVFYSRRWKEMLGYTDEEVGEHIDEWRRRVHPDDLARAEAALQAHLQGASPAYECEHRLRARDGSYRWILDRGRVVERDARGQPLRVIGTHTDITARKEAELALQASEERYRTLIAAMGEGVVVHAADGRVSLYNEAACRILGCSGEELKTHFFEGAGWRAVDELGHRLRANPALQVLQGGGAIAGQVAGVLRPDGVRVWLSLSAWPVLQAPGAGIAEVVTTFSDISGIRAAELDAHMADAVVENSGQPIVVTDRAGIVQRANPAFCDSVGYTSGELVGRPVGALVKSGRHEAGFYRQLWQALEAQGSWSGEIWNRRHNGEVFPAWLTITAVRDHAGAIQEFVGVYTDITERKRHEEALWQAANYDALTGLPNRLLFREHLAASLARVRRTGTRMALMFVDVDHFKQVNDRYGHQAGDRVLQAVAQRLQDGVREDDLVARISGDEFVVLLHNLPDGEAVQRVADGLVAAMRQPVAVGEGGMVTVGCSIGVALCPDDGEDAEGLLRLADSAMYEAKQGGRQGWRRYRAQQQEPH